jgi:hypothetical protein
MPLYTIFLFFRAPINKTIENENKLWKNSQLGTMSIWKFIARNSNLAHGFFICWMCKVPSKKNWVMVYLENLFVRCFQPLGLLFSEKNFSLFLVDERRILFTLNGEKKNSTIEYFIAQ